MIHLTEGILLQIEPHENMTRLHKIVPMLNEYMSLFHLNETKLRVAHFLAQILHESGGFTIMKEDWSYTKKNILDNFHRYFKNGVIPSKYIHSPNLFNLTYANRMGNGNEASGDGFRYRGRGILQLTGKESYRKFTVWYQQTFPLHTSFNFLSFLELIEKKLQGTSWDNEFHRFIQWYRNNYTFQYVPIDFVKHPELINTDMKYAVLSALWEFSIDKNLNHSADTDNFVYITHRINGGNNGKAKRFAYLIKAKKALGI